MRKWENKLIGVKRGGFSGRGWGTLSAMGLLLAACQKLDVSSLVSPSLASKELELISLADEPNKRGLKVAFTEAVRLKDASKVYLIQTTDEKGVALKEPLTIEASKREVSVVDDKSVVVKFTPLGVAKYKVVFKVGSVEDVEGNEFDPSGDEGETNEVGVDLTAPRAPRVVLLDAKEEGGVIYYAKAGELKFTLEDLASDVGTERKIYIKEAGGTLQLLSATINDVDGKRVVTVTEDDFDTDGTYTVVGKVRDKAGNESEASADFVFTVDRMAPDAPRVVLLDAKEEGGVIYYAKAGDLKFTLEDLASDVGTERKIYLKEAGGTLQLLSATINDGGGKRVVTVTDALFDTDGTYTVVGKVRDKAGNESEASADFVFTVDRMAPDAPRVVLLDAKEEGGVTYYAKAGELKFTLEDLASDVGTERKIYIKEAGGTLQLLSATINDVDGKRVVTVTEDDFDTDGTYTVVGKVRDKAGNESEASADFVFTVDRTAPDKPVVALKGGGSGVKTTSPTLTLSNLEVGASVVIYEGDKEIARIDNVKVDTVDYQLEGLALGQNTIKVKLVDEAGNESELSDGLTFAVELPLLSLHTRTPDGFEYKSPVFVVKANDGDRVALYKGDVRVSEIETVGANGERFLSLLGDKGVVRDDEIVVRVLDSDDKITDTSASVFLSGLDVKAPIALSVEGIANNVYITVKFDEKLSFVGDKSQFSVAGHTVSHATIDASDPTKLLLALDERDHPVQADVEYAVTWASGAVEDRAGNRVAAKTTALTGTGVANDDDETGPVIFSDGGFSQYYPVSLHGSTLKLRILFDEELDTSYDEKLTTSNIKIYKVVEGGDLEIVLFGIEGVYFDRNITSNIYVYMEPNFSLESGQHYRVRLDAGTVSDTQGNLNEALSYDLVFGGVSNDFIRPSKDHVKSKGLTIVDAYTLQVDFTREIERGYDEGLRIEEKIPNGGYKAFSSDFVTSVSGKTLTIRLEKALKEDDFYHVKYLPYTVKDEAFDRYGYYQTWTETKKYSVPSEQVDDESVGLSGLSEEFTVDF